MRMATPFMLVVAVVMLFTPASVQAGGPVDEFLRGWEGKWSATAGYARGGGAYTVAWSAADVTHPGGTSIAFTVKPADGSIVFDGSLKAAGPNQYVLTITSAKDAVVEVPVQYSPDTGFAGNGTFKSVAVEATITRDDKGYELKVVDPKVPKDNNYIISLSFFDRKPK